MVSMEIKDNVCQYRVNEIIRKYEEIMRITEIKKHII